MVYRTVFCSNCKQRKKGYGLGGNKSICLGCSEEIIETIIRREQKLKIRKDGI